jgi:lysophospholipase L1-like esterase
MRICFIGDSFVNGTGDDDCLGWTGRICADARRRGCDVTHYNLGIRRNTTADIWERWEREARARLAPEHDGRLVFSFGVNDCVSEEPGHVRVPEAASVDTARSILGKAKTWRPSLVIGPPPSGDTDLNERVKRLSDRFDALCGDLSIPFLSPWDRLMASETWLLEVEMGDGAHPNGGGYAVLADFIMAWPPWRSWINAAR